MGSGAGVHDSLLVFGSEIVRGALVVNDGVSSAGGLLLLHGSVQVDGDVELHGSTTAGLSSLAGGMLVSQQGLRIGHRVRVEALDGFPSGRMGLAASGGVNARRGAAYSSVNCIGTAAKLL